MSLAVKPFVVERRTTASRVAEILREELLAGEHEPGTPLRDQELARRADVSRPTAREALAELARDGLVVHSLHRGIEVARLTEADIRDVYALRVVIECEGVERMRGEVRDEILAKLSEACVAMARAEHGGDRRAAVAADVAFHSALAGATGSRRLISAHTSALLELRLALAVTDRVNRQWHGETGAHRALAWEIASGSRAKGRRALERHLEEAADRVCAVLGSS